MRRALAHTIRCKLPSVALLACFLHPNYDRSSDHHGRLDGQRGLTLPIMAYPMHFVTLAGKNLTRRSTRSALTILGLATAIAAVVSLVGIVRGFQQSLLTVYLSDGIDVVVYREAGLYRSSMALDETLADEVAKLPGVRDASPSLNDVIGLPELGVNTVILQGNRLDSFLLDEPKIVAGRRMRPDDRHAVMLGSRIAADLGKTAGDTLRLPNETDYTVVGVFESRYLMKNGIVFLKLDELQQLTGREGSVTGCRCSDRLGESQVSRAPQRTNQGHGTRGGGAADEGIHRVGGRDSPGQRLGMDDFGRGTGRWMHWHDQYHDHFLSRADSRNRFTTGGRLAQMASSGAHSLRVIALGVERRRARIAPGSRLVGTAPAVAGGGPRHFGRDCTKRLRSGLLARRSRKPGRGRMCGRNGSSIASGERPARAVEITEQVRNRGRRDVAKFVSWSVLLIGLSEKRRA